MLNLISQLRAILVPDKLANYAEITANKLALISGPVRGRLAAAKQ